MDTIVLQFDLMIVQDIVYIHLRIELRYLVLTIKWKFCIWIQSLLRESKR